MADGEEFRAEGKLRVLTLNCWGIPYVSKLRSERFTCIADELAKGHYDIVSLQEVWSKDDYEYIKLKVEDCLPHSHYFYSGIIGSGVCVFSQFPIIDVFTYRFSLNGYLYNVHHGDWFGGKSAGYCLIDHPKVLIHFFTTHLHAEYCRQSDEYLAHRLIQAYQLSQFIQHLTKPADTVMVCGDLNSEPNDLCFQVIKHLSGLTDAWVQSGRRNGGYGNTCDVSHNSFTTVKVAKDLRGGPKDGKRIDYILYRGADGNKLECTRCCVTMGPVPGKSFSYSDHEGVSATFQVTENVIGKTTTEGYSLNNKKNQEILGETLHELVKGRTEATSYKLKNLVLTSFLFLFVLMPMVFPPVPGSLLSLDAALGKLLYIVRIIATMFLAGNLYYIIFNTREEWSAYTAVEKEILMKMNQFSPKRKVKSPRC